MSNGLSFILADDHPLILEGNAAFLSKNGFLIKGVATNGNDAFNQILKEQPDFAILDMDMPVLNGIEVARALKGKQFHIKIIILSLHKNEDILRNIGLCIDGYILKEDALSELLTCIDVLLSHKNYVSSTIKNANLYDPKNEEIKNLTVSEVKILRLIAKNMTSQEIADSLFLSKRTVEKHRSNVVKKLNLDSSPHALVLWVQKNIDSLL
ncbi:response regulator transcription factor [Galbibacter pacificus]|uniref:Response regulator transcription factor n=1 Tax=Galbibacter pacificus TaxID=2996052 RepID=A0ABT6FRT3_9FLAO|nr:response regulator transcription factor [Galbibacter pacificus]MDG3582906.1 response regulator transcription factor [Galbibacter pacificus]MDG3585975.1 response regulator transcription factor [Galbibacter pacificus]